MASGTQRYLLTNGEPVRIDGGNAFVTGIVTAGDVQMFYVSGVDNPALTGTGVPLLYRDPFSFEMGEGDSLWVVGWNGAEVAVMGREV